MAQQQGPSVEPNSFGIGTFVRIVGFRRQFSKYNGKPGLVRSKPTEDDKGIIRISVCIIETGETYAFEPKNLEKADLFLLSENEFILKSVVEAEYIRIGRNIPIDLCECKSSQNELMVALPQTALGIKNMDTNALMEIGEGLIDTAAGATVIDRRAAMFGLSRDSVPITTAGFNASCESKGRSGTITIKQNGRPLMEIKMCPLLVGDRTILGIDVLKLVAKAMTFGKNTNEYGKLFLNEECRQRMRLAIMDGVEVPSDQFQSFLPKWKELKIEKSKKSAENQKQKQNQNDNVGDIKSEPKGSKKDKPSSGKKPRKTRYQTKPDVSFGLCDPINIPLWQEEGRCRERLMNEFEFSWEQAWEYSDSFGVDTEKFIATVNAMGKNKSEMNISAKGVADSNIVSPNDENAPPQNVYAKQ